MADVTLTCGWGCNSIDGCQGHCSAPRYNVEAIPADLAMCNRCRRVFGDYGGKYGEECECAPPVSERSRIEAMHAELWQPTDTDAQGYEKFAVALETQADEMSAAMEAFEGHADVVAGFMCTASWLRRTAKAIRELVK